MKLGLAWHVLIWLHRVCAPRIPMGSKRPRLESAHTLDGARERMRAHIKRTRFLLGSLIETCSEPARSWPQAPATTAPNFFRSARLGSARRAFHFIPVAHLGRHRSSRAEPDEEARLVRARTSSIATRAAMCKLARSQCANIRALALGSSFAFPLVRFLTRSLRV